MRYPFLASALSLVVASGIAYADEDAPAPSPAASTDQTSNRVENVDLFFDTDSAMLGDDASSDLEALAKWTKCSSKNAIILEGHADPRGTKEHNLTLSGERAAQVRQRLIDMGVPSQRIVVTVYGELGDRRDSLNEDRRVTARGTDAPVDPEDLSI